MNPPRRHPRNDPSSETALFERRVRTFRTRNVSSDFSFVIRNRKRSYDSEKTSDSRGETRARSRSSRKALLRSRGRKLTHVRLPFWCIRTYFVRSRIGTFRYLWPETEVTREKTNAFNYMMNICNRKEIKGSKGRLLYIGHVAANIFYYRHNFLFLLLRKISVGLLLKKKNASCV